MTPAGRFDRVLACDEPVRNEAGEITSFVETFTVRANIEPLKGREQLQANQILADMDTRIRVRWSPRNARIDATWRLRYDQTSTVYDIKAPPADIGMKHIEIEILAKSGLNNG